MNECIRGGPNCWPLHRDLQCSIVLPPAWNPQQSNLTAASWCKLPGASNRSHEKRLTNTHVASVFSATDVLLLTDWKCKGWPTSPGHLTTLAADGDCARPAVFARFTVVHLRKHWLSFVPLLISWLTDYAERWHVQCLTYIGHFYSFASIVR
jgi:hypothetical protein